MAIVLRLLFVLLVVILLFISGMLVTHYRVFPYHHLNSVISSPEYMEDQQNADYFWRKVSHHQQWKDQTFDMVFVGDSLTNEGEWQQFMPDLRIANMGINADTTMGVLKRIDTVTAVKAPTVFLMIGVNDLLQGQKQEQIVARYRQIVARLAERFETVYVQSCLFVGPRYQSRTSDIMALNQAIQAMASGTENVEYVDLNSMLAINNLLNPAYTNDDIHLNGLGYQAWWKIVAQTLDITLVIKD